MRAGFCVPLALAFLAACGGPEAATPVQPSLHLTSVAEDLKCSDQAQVGADGVAVMVGCPFEQQMHNIRTNGAPLGTKPVVMMDAEGRIDASLTHECGSWLLGQDSQGAYVLVHRATGEVRSHGTMHPGQPISLLPATLPTPLSF
jgi:hypothetical protein